MRHVLIPFEISPGAPAVGAQVHCLQGLTMGTTWSVQLVASADRQLDSLQAGVQQQLDEVVQQMSTWEPVSHLGRYNRAPAGTWHDVPREFLFVLRQALDVAQASDGAYDPSAGPLVNLWGFGPEQKQLHRPDAAQLAAVRNCVGWQRVLIDPISQRVLQPGGAYLDFSAIAKGFGVDQVSRYLQQQGIDNHLVEVGGELRGMGFKPDCLPWWVALEQPPTRDGSSIAVLSEVVIALHGVSVATSGDYRRYFEVDAKRYSHTIDPRSGEPIQHGLASVTVIHPDCIAADALSTALNVLGVEQGMTFAEQRGLPARFVVRSSDGFNEHLSSAFTKMMQ